jgi:hypothetical protein
MGTTAPSEPQREGQDAAAPAAPAAPPEALVQYARANRRRSRLIRLVIVAAVALSLAYLSIDWVHRRVQNLDADPHVGPIDWPTVLTTPSLWSPLCSLIINPHMFSDPPPVRYSGPKLSPFLGSDPDAYDARIKLPITTTMRPFPDRDSIEYKIRVGRHVESVQHLYVTVAITNTTDRAIWIPPYSLYGVAGEPSLHNQWCTYEDNILSATAFGGFVYFRGCLSAGVAPLRPGDQIDITVPLRIYFDYPPSPNRIQLQLYGTLHEFLIDPAPGMNDWSEVTEDMIESARFAPGIPPPLPRLERQSGTP